MNIRKFIAPTAREALNDIRNQLGSEAVILSNRKVDNGVEIIALANEEMTKITDTFAGENAQGAKHMVQKARTTPVDQKSSVAPESSILGEIQSMHSTLQQHLSTLFWNDVQQRDPKTAGLLCKMLNAGFSAQLARHLLDNMPAGNVQGVTWINQVLKHNLLVVDDGEDIVTKGGVYALIGPTGVGKTTTTAKLAARAVVRYGADKVALLTTDSYRIGAYEQLKIYGKILGVEVHAVKGTEDLRLTISSLRDKYLVLIDTVGMGQRDERVGDQSEMFNAASVPCLLLLNSTSTGDTLDDVVRMYHSDKVIGCIPTKLDESVNLGTVLDVVIRHRLVMHYMTNGQCVPEDLHPINLDYLLHRALKPAETQTPFTLNAMEFPVLMADLGSRQGLTRVMTTDARLSGYRGRRSSMDTSYAL